VIHETADPNQTAPTSRRLHVFDMDGTLLPGTTACAELAKVLRTEDVLHLLEARFRAGELDTPGFASAIHEAWGVLSRQTVLSAFEACPKLQNIERVVFALRDSGHATCLITMSPDYFAEEFYALGFDHILASRFPRQLEHALDTSGILRPEDKPRLVEDLCTRLGISARDVIAYGDSMSDRHLFSWASLSVAVNGDHFVRDLATLHYEGSDLWEVHELVERHVGA